MVVQGNLTTAKTQAMTFMQLTDQALRRNPKTRSSWGDPRLRGRAGVGARSGMLDRGNFELVSAQLSQDQTMQDVILLVEQVYYQVLGLQAVVGVDRQSFKDAGTNLAAAQDRRARSI